MTFKSPQGISLPSIEDMARAHQELLPHVLRTPWVRWLSEGNDAAFSQNTEVFMKLELLQRTGSFKVRGAFLSALRLSEQERGRGLIAVSAGNHAKAVALAGRSLDIPTTVVMFASANPARIAACKALGARVVLEGTPKEAFARAESMVQSEGLSLIHPFEGEDIVLGTSGVGLELAQDIPMLDAVIVPIGGGGLASGVASAVLRLQPDCDVYGVEPEGAASMRKSLEAGEPIALERVETIADSLGAPYALPYTFGICRALLKEVVSVRDEDLRRAMGMVFRDAKLICEPATVAAHTALLGPLRERLEGKRVALILCGSNIDLASFQKLAME